MASASSLLHCSSFRSKPFIILVALLVTIACFVYTPLPSTLECADNSDAVVCRVKDKAKNTFSSNPQDEDSWQPAELSTVKSKYAFATFLAGRADSDDNDPYFINARMLAYQLLHAPGTASRDKSIPFIVLVTEKVSEAKRERLRKDGAIVVLGKNIKTDWVNARVETWADVMTKLRLWELTQFEKICLLDGDTVVVQPLDGVFADHAAATQNTRSVPAETKADEGAIPSTYNFAGVPEMNRDHGYPPTAAHKDFPNPDYLNSGFFVFKPDLQVLSYYLSLLKLPNRFKPDFPEQNLLNYAHRREGNMPWTQLNNTWNIHYPTVQDLQGGVKSLHDKWWAPEHEELRPFMDSWRWKMEGFYEAMDRFQAKS